jgi:hypothetical protein
MKTILVHKKYRTIYVTQDLKTWTNISTGQIGTKTDEQLKQDFAIPLTLNNMANCNSKVLNLIENLKMILE